MNILNLVASSDGGEKSGSSFNHHLAHGLEAGFIDKIKATLKNTIEGYKAQSLEERGIEQVLQMSDSMLKDIGLTHSDRISLKAGLTSLEELNAQRENYYRQFD
jgi:uncharacterized protein YjiS (DUF1127 family)